MPDRIVRKWRPRLWSVVMIVLGLVLCLPVAGLLLFKFYANELVRQTEESLLTQASILSAMFAQLYAENTGTAEPDWVTSGGSRVDAIYPSLSITDRPILPPRPDAVTTSNKPQAVYRGIGPKLSHVAHHAQTQTLAGYRLLDPVGNIIGGSAEVGLSLGNVDEVSRALAGETVSVARFRIRETPEPFLYRFSWGARVRVFVAMPVFVEGEIVGAVYLSRTPNHIFRFLHGERISLARAALFVIVSTCLIGFVFWRFITNPIHALIQRTHAIGDGHGPREPIAHLGTREIENLSRSFQSLTDKLQGQQSALKSYTAHVTHELKSPLTAVKGATELLSEQEMSAEQRQRFLANIERDISRIESLLESMRAFSLADQTAIVGASCLEDVAEDIRATFSDLEVETGNRDVALPVHRKTLLIILKHLLENAAEHRASTVALNVGRTGKDVWMTVKDDGSGISAGNRDKVLTPFFTTRRDQGGTGMGLNIVKSIVETVGGDLQLEQADDGTCFRVLFRKAIRRAA